MVEKTILVLGSKPDPILPPPLAYQELACANGSGASAFGKRLAIPAFTVMSAILGSGITSGRQTLEVLQGLQTTELYFFPRPPSAVSVGKQLTHPLQSIRTRSWYLKHRLRSLSYSYERFFDFRYSFYHDLVMNLCEQSPEVLKTIQHKQPSTGLMTVALALSRSEQVIIAGFSFELTHAYDRNPEIDERGTQISRHANTDITILRCLSRKCPQLETTEPVVAESTGIRLYNDNR